MKKSKIIALTITSAIISGLFTAELIQNKKANKRRKEVLKKYDFGKILVESLDLNIQELNQEDSGRIYEEILKLRDELNSSKSISRINYIDNELDIIKGLLTKKSKNKIQSYIQYLKDSKETERETYERNLLMTTINNEHTENLEKIKSNVRIVESTTKAATNIVDSLISKDKN